MMDKEKAIHSYEDFLRRYLPDDVDRLLTEHDPDYRPGAVEATEAVEKSMARFSGHRDRRTRPAASQVRRSAS